MLILFLLFTSNIHNFGIILGNISSIIQLCLLFTSDIDIYMYLIAFATTIHVIYFLTYLHYFHIYLVIFQLNDKEISTNYSLAWVILMLLHSLFLYVDIYDYHNSITNFVLNYYFFMLLNRICNAIIMFDNLDNIWKYTILKYNY